MTHTKLLTIILGALFLLAVSLVTRVSQLYFMSAVLGAIPVISYAFGRIALRSIACSRRAPEFASEGELITVTLSVRGRSRLLGPIRIEDTLPEWIVHSGRAGRISGGPEFVEAGTAMGVPGRNITAGAVEFSYGAVPVKRGLHTIGPLRIRATDPLGLFDFRLSYPVLSRVTTFPTALRLDELRSASGGEFGDFQFEGGGAKGSGIDFHGIREYQPGDELRRVYWKSTARYGRLSVIEFEHSLAQDTLIAVDLREGSEIGRGRFSSLEYGVRLAAGLASDAVSGGSAVRLVAAGLDDSATAAGWGADHLYSVLSTLAHVGADQQEAVSSVILRRIDQIASGSSVVCITSAGDSGLAECAAFLKARQIRMTVIVTYMLPHRDEKIDALIAGLSAAGATVLTVACSPEAPMARVTYQHAA